MATLIQDDVIPAQAKFHHFTASGEPHLRECVICFNQISRTAVDLPCACQVDYCEGCWERALAQSFNSCGQARCPTCREPVCVDFDAKRSRLTYSRQLHSIADVATYRIEAMQKLREQALPAQVDILRRYGRRHTHLGIIARTPETKIVQMSIAELRRCIEELGGSPALCVEKIDLVNRLLLACKEPLLRAQLLGSDLASACVEAPLCVCGSSLEWVSGEERVNRCCDNVLQGESRDSARFQMIRENLAATQESICFCDLCNTPIPFTHPVWTCQNSNSTILHASSYDVCAACFMRYTDNTDMEPTTQCSDGSRGRAGIAL